MSEETASARLRALEEAEADNFRANLASLGEAMLAYDDLYKITDDLAPVFQKTIATAGDATAFAVLTNLYQLMRQDLIKGMLSLSKGYITDASFQTRRIIEAAAVIIEMINYPGKVPYYANLTDNRSVKKYVERFKIYSLVKTNLSQMSLGHYDFLCLAVHPSALAVGSRGVFTAPDTHTLSFFEVMSEADVPRLRQDVFIYLAIVLEVFKGLGEALSINPAFDSETWAATMERYSETLRDHIEREKTHEVAD
jgi:hypothetical protein